MFQCCSLKSFWLSFLNLHQTISAFTSQYRCLYFPCSPSRYIVPLEIGWSNQICHFIRGSKMQGNWGWWKNDVAGHPCLSTGLPWHLQAARPAPKIHLLYSGAVSGSTLHRAPLLLNTRCTAHLSKVTLQESTPVHLVSHSTLRDSHSENTESEMNCVHRCR